MSSESMSSRIGTDKWLDNPKWSNNKPSTDNSNEWWDKHARRKSFEDVNNR